MREEGRSIDHEYRLRVCPADHADGRTNLVWRPHSREVQLYPQRTRGPLEVLDGPGVPRRGWIPDDSDAGEHWDRLLEQLQPLDAEFGEHDRQPGDVSTGPREIRDQAGSDGIRNDGHHDGDGGRRALGLLNRR